MNDAEKRLIIPLAIGQPPTPPPTPAPEGPVKTVTFPAPVVYRKPIRKKGKKKSEKAKNRDSARYIELKKKHPGICAGCWGDGAVLLDSSTAKRLDIALCPGCLDKGRCPKCSKSLPKGWRENVEEFLEPPVKCRNCGWEDGDLPLMDEDYYDE